MHTVPFYEELEYRKEQMYRHGQVKTDDEDKFKRDWLKEEKVAAEYTQYH